MKAEYVPFDLSSELLEEVEGLISNTNDVALSVLLSNYHHADIAEILENLNFDNALYIIKLLDSETTAEILMDVDEDVREKILENLSAKEIAEELEELDSDDAADIIQELPENRKASVISKIEDEEHVADIKELITYDEDSAGGLMAKELVKVNINWNVLKCIKEMRIQAEEVTRVHSIYVVDNNNILKGRLSLKDLLITSNKAEIKEVYIPKVDYVSLEDKGEDVVKKMQKYDLEAIPVVNDRKQLMGRITIDDIVDFMKEEAEKDYQMAAGIVQDVDSDDSILDLTKARIPWLFLGLLGGLGAALIMRFFDHDDLFDKFKDLLFFTPLIAAMAGNVGVQSSAIIVQGLANDDISGSIFSRLLKEMSLAIVNGLILSIILLLLTFVIYSNIKLSLTISISLFAVIIVAGIIGTFIPLFLHKRGIDPAIATGPFITTCNDIFGILIYFIVAKAILF